MGAHPTALFLFFREVRSCLLAGPSREASVKLVTPSQAGGAPRIQRALEHCPAQPPHPAITSLDAPIPLLGNMALHGGEGAGLEEYKAHTSPCTSAPPPLCVGAGGAEGWRARCAPSMPIMAWRLQLQNHAEKGQMWATCLWGSLFVHGKLPQRGSGGGCSGGISGGIHPLQPAAAVAEAHRQPPDRVLVPPPAPRLRCDPVGSRSPPPSFGRATPAKPPEEDRGRMVTLPGAWRLGGDHITQTPVRTLRFLVSPQ